MDAGMEKSGERDEQLRAGQQRERKEKLENGVGGRVGGGAFRLTS
jgi:hypothetical protein